MPVPLLRRLAYAQEWESTMLPKSAAFREWTRSYLQATAGEERIRLQLEGVELARARRVEMRMLIERDPERALATTVPASVRRALPSVIVAELETRVAGTGDYALMCMSPTPGPRGFESIRRFAMMGRESYVAHGYGRRDAQLSKERTSLHGIVLDGHMAVHENPLRVLEAGDTPDRAVEMRDPMTFAPVATDAEDEAALLVEAHGKIWRLSDARAVALLDRRLSAAETLPGGKVSPLLLNLPADHDPAVTPSAAAAWTTGTVKFLVIRVDFPDVPGEWMSAAAGQDAMDQSVTPYFDRASYGRVALRGTVTSKLYRLPKAYPVYAATPRRIDDIFDDAVAMAAGDFSVNDYDRVVIAMPDITKTRFPDSPFFSGQAQLGGRRAWISGTPVPGGSRTQFGPFVHELGHTFGLDHATLWQTKDGNPISSNGTVDEYGDRFDAMGGTGNQLDDALAQHFNPASKHRLGWLPSEAVSEIEQSGVYRLFRFDHKSAPQNRSQALRLFRDGQRTYWIGYRQNFPANTSLTNGAYVFWTEADSLKTQLLDFTPNTDQLDVALSIGATLNDAEYGIRVRPIARGGVDPEQYLDIDISVRTPPNIAVGWGSNSEFVPSSFAVKAIAAGERHGLALKTNGTVVAWGDNTYGQSRVPAELRDVESIGAGGNVSAAVRTDGSVVLWGDASTGLTTPPSGLGPVRQIAIGFDHVVALRVDQTVVSWGNNSSGQTSAPNIGFISQIAAGHQWGMMVNGSNVYPWGTLRGTPAPAHRGNTVKIAAGSYHGIIARSDGTVEAWGDNTYGQCNVPGGLRDVVAVAAGSYHSLALKSDGTVVAWGENSTGQTTIPSGLQKTFLIAAGGRQSLAASVPLLITAQPQTQDFTQGTTRTFSVAATGQGPFTYQWRKDGISIAGATGATLTLAGVASTDIAIYDVVVTGARGSTTSAPASLGTEVGIKTQPRTQFGVIREDATFTVEATGSEPTYQWRKNQVPIPGATHASLTLRNIAYVDRTYGGGIDVVVKNLFGSVGSRAVDLVAFEAYSDGATAQAGTEITFRIGRDGTQAPSNQWRRNGVNIPGATTETYRIASLQPSDTGVYTMVATLPDGSFTSNGVPLSVGPTPLSIASQPIGKTAAVGEGVTFRVVALGNPAPRYQWRKDGVAIPGATASTYTMPSVAYGDVAGYSVVVSNAQGSVTSDVAKLTVPGAFSRFVNLSVRSNAGSGAETLIVGFVVSGTGQKQLLIRGVGPTLATFGVTNTLADPSLRLLAADGRVLNQNDDWGGTPALVGASAQVGAFALPPNSKDAALLAALPAGAYSVQVAAAAAAGVVLVEAYDADAAVSPPARLVNLSVRSIAGSDGNALIAGFVISGNISKTLLIRGVGPTLAAFGVGGVLADPQLALFDSTGFRLNQNDNWGGDSTLAEAFFALGAFALPANSSDAALLVTLPPGAYSAQVSGAGGATGVALVEIYEVP